jgi:uncharacterized protein YfkK (UPF0435 family)
MINQEWLASNVINLCVEMGFKKEEVVEMIKSKSKKLNFLNKINLKNKKLEMLPFKKLKKNHIMYH